MIWVEVSPLRVKRDSQYNYNELFKAAFQAAFFFTFGRKSEAFFNFIYITFFFL